MEEWMHRPRYSCFRYKLLRVQLQASAALPPLKAVPMLKQLINNP
jgi:hypothetical protein